MKLLKIMALYAALLIMVVLYSSAEDEIPVTSNVHFEYQQF